MITANENIKSMINSPVRKITAKVELYEGSTLVDTFSHDGKLIDFTIERVVEEDKFFGFGVCQHIKVNILDTNREIDYITPAYSLKIAYGVNGEYIYTHPTFYITQTRRDENTNQLSIYGYDAIYPAAAHYTSELTYTTPYTIQQFATICASFLSTAGLSIQRIGESETCFATNYENGANLEGTETIREVLDDIAEATQTVYFINNEDKLVFKRLDANAANDIVIDKSKYFDLNTEDGRRLKTICHATELGDNVSASVEASGSTQYVRDNIFWEMRDDIDTLVNNALAAVGGMSIRQFDCSWRGNFLAEIGDKIALTTKDNDIVISYLLDDTIEYNGSLQEKSQWSYKEDAETESNPSSLGDVLKQTYAKVDKANKEITIMASGVESNSNEISKLNINTENIFASVKRIETNTETAITDVNKNINELTTKVESTMTAEDVKLEIKSELANGVNSITTSTGFTFNDEGLTVEKSGSEMKTQITEDGMTVFRDETAVLVANNIGVQATNLQANTYLIIGNNSRFEDYDSGTRTGCFWIGN